MYTHESFIPLLIRYVNSQARNNIRYTLHFVKGEANFVYRGKEKKTWVNVACQIRAGQQSFEDNRARTVPRQSMNWYRYCNNIIDIFSYWDCSPTVYMYNMHAASGSGLWMHSFMRVVSMCYATTTNLGRKAKDPVFSFDDRWKFGLPL